MAQTSHAHAIALTPLGAVTLDVSGSSDLVITVATADIPDLPEGMNIDGVMLFSVRLASPVTSTSPVRVRVTADQNGDPESGQWLDSMSFRGPGGVLQVAIRDDEWLASNGVIAEPVQYERQGLSQVITEAPGGLMLYASAAWRIASLPIANTYYSTWFAADLLLPI